MVAWRNHLPISRLHEYLRGLRLTGNHGFNSCEPICSHMQTKHNLPDNIFTQKVSFMGAFPLVVCGLLHRNSKTGQIARLWICAWLCAMFSQTPWGECQVHPLHNSFNTFSFHPFGCHNFWLLESSKSCSSTSDRDFSRVERTQKERRAHFHSRNSTEQVAIHCCFYLFGMLDSFLGYSHNKAFFICKTYAKKFGTVVHVFSLHFKHCQSHHICRNEFYIQERVSPYLILWVDDFVLMHTGTNWTRRTWTWPSDVRVTMFVPDNCFGN